MVVSGPLFELNDTNWHLWGRMSDLVPEHVCPEMLDPHLERVRALLQDRRIVDLENVHRPDCLELLHTAIRLTDEAIAARTIEKVEEAAQALYDAAQPTWDYLQSLMIGALGPFGAFFFDLAIFEGRPAREIGKYLEKNWAWGPDRWTSESAALLLRDAESITPLILRPLQREILKALTGRALKKMALAAKVCGGEANGNILYRPGGIKELMARGIVKWESGVGFYRPDAPPPDAIVAS